MRLVTILLVLGVAAAAVGAVRKRLSRAVPADAATGAAMDRWPPVPRKPGPPA